MACESWIMLLLGSGCRVVEPDWATADRYYTAIAKVPKFSTAKIGQIRSRSFAHTKSRSVTVVGRRNFGGELWFRIRLLSNDQCDGPDPHEIASGWVRAYSAKRQPVVMHISRGC